MKQSVSHFGPRGSVYVSCPRTTRALCCIEGGHDLSREVAGAPMQQPGETYRPPPEGACRTADYAIPLDKFNRLFCHQRIYKRRIVHFSIEHQHLWDGTWTAVARIDTSGSIHLHLWDRYGTVLKDHELMSDIPPSPQGQSVVHNWFQEAFNYLDERWLEHLRSWSE